MSEITPGALKVKAGGCASDFSMPRASNVIALCTPRRRRLEVVAVTRTYMRTTVVLSALTAPLGARKGWCWSFESSQVVGVGGGGVLIKVHGINCLNCLSKSCAWVGMKLIMG